MPYTVLIRRTLILRTMVPVADAQDAREAEPQAVAQVERSVLFWSVDDGRRWEQETDAVEAFDVCDEEGR